MKLRTSESNNLESCHCPFEPHDYKELAGNGLRCNSTKTMLRLVLPKVSSLGITRISDITDLDHIGIPVISAIRPSVDDLQITATQGKGLRKIDALLSALMEAVERFSASQFKDYTAASQNDLTVSKVPFLPIKLLGGNIDIDLVIDWVKCISLNSGSIYLAPAADVVFPYTPQNGIARPFRPSTTGISSGATRAEALLHAIFEVIERDAVSKFFLGGSASVTDLNSITSKVECVLINRIHKAGIDILILDLSSLAPIPVYYVSLLNTQGAGPDIACAGQGAHLNPTVALRRAITEAAQSRAVAIQGSREDLIRHASDWQGKYEKFRIMRENMKKEAISLGGITPLPLFTEQHISIENGLRLVREKLATSGYSDIFMTDLTHPHIQIPAVHALIPGMVDNIVDPTRLRTLTTDMHLYNL